MSENSLGVGKARRFVMKGRKDLLARNPRFALIGCCFSEFRCSIMSFTIQTLPYRNDASPTPRRVAEHAVVCAMACRGLSCEIFNRIVSIRKYIFFIFTIKKRDSVTLSQIKPVVHFYGGISTKRNLSDETAKPVR